MANNLGKIIIITRYNLGITMRKLTELREKAIWDEKDIYVAGLDKGIKQKTIEIAKKMKEENIDINIISRVTNISITEIEKL